jgi:hypothetical protein
MIAGHGLFDLKMVEQPEGIPGILRRYEVDLAQGVEDALCDIAEIPDRGGTQI